MVLALVLMGIGLVAILSVVVGDWGTMDEGAVQWRTGARIFLLAGCAVLSIVFGVFLTLTGFSV